MVRVRDPIQMVDRQCGECTLCCRLVPVQELDKAANQQCRYRQFRKGCRIYATRPHSCRTWTCRWLTDPDTLMLWRPDQAHYVIDGAPDFVEIQETPESPRRRIPVIQIWVDPKLPNSHRDYKLRRYLEKQWLEHEYLGLIRFDADKALLLIPPAATSDKQWRAFQGVSTGHENSPEEIIKTCGSAFLESVS